MNRSEVYAVIDSERAYQDAKYPPDSNGKSASPEGFLLVLEHLLNETRKAYVGCPTPKEHAVLMDGIRKIGATAVRAMEQYGVETRAAVVERFLKAPRPK